MVKILSDKASGTKENISSSATNADDTQEETAKKEAMLEILKKRSVEKQEEAVSPEEAERVKREKIEAMLEILSNKAKQ